jgi:hypothetical protein
MGYCTYTASSVGHLYSRSGFHQCPSECLFSFENSPYAETLSNASEFIGDTLNIWYNDGALVYFI